MNRVLWEQAVAGKENLRELEGSLLFCAVELNIFRYHQPKWLTNDKESQNSVSFTISVNSGSIFFLIKEEMAQLVRQVD